MSKMSKMNIQWLKWDNLDLDGYTLFGKIVVMPLQVLFMVCLMAIFAVGWFIEEGLTWLTYKPIKQEE